MNEDKFLDQIASLNRPFDHPGDNEGASIKSLENVRERALRMDIAEGAEQKQEEPKGWHKFINRLKGRGESSKTKTTQELLNETAADRFSKLIILSKIRGSSNWKEIEDAKVDPESLFDETQRAHFQRIPEQQKRLILKEVSREAMLRSFELEKQLAKKISKEIEDANTFEQLCGIVGMMPNNFDQFVRDNKTLVYDRLVTRLTVISGRQNVSSSPNAISRVATDLTHQFNNRKIALQGF